MRATWYVLEDGDVVDPSECSSDDKGVLTHESGVKVAMRFADCPMSRGVDVDASGKRLFGGKGDHDNNGSAGGAARKGKASRPKDVKPEDSKGGYKTRETKAD